MNVVNTIVSSDREQLILVDENDQEIGQLTKRECHLDEGVLHRAFSIFIFNTAGDVLLQQRSKQKFLWPGYWSNACCSHPRAGEESVEAAHRRLEQELGIKTELTYLYKFVYHAQFSDHTEGTVGSEHELCWVWIGITDNQEITANANEVADWRFFNPNELNDALLTTPTLFTPWMKMEWEKINADYRELLPA